MTKFGIGQPVSRLEDPRFITGRGRYVDDINLPQQCYGVVVMSPHAHARIKSIDTSRAEAAAGVIAVLTGADVQADKLGSFSPVMPEDMGGPKGYRTMRSILAVDKVRSVGERVVFVVAETAAQARDAADLVEVEYEALPAVVSMEEAIKPGAPAVWDEAPNNVSVGLMMGNKEATDAAFAQAKHVVSLKLVNSRVSANAIEPRAAIGQYHPDSGSYTLYSTSQNPHGTRAHVAGNVLKVTENKLRVISPDVGGGFGMKNGNYPEDALVCWASRRVGGRPVKWTATRSEVVPRRFPRPRSSRDRRTGARRAGQDSRHAHECAPCHGLAHVRGLGGGAAVRAQTGAGRLQHSGGSCRRADGSDQHRADGALSRRRTAGGDFPDRAIDRARRARHRRRFDRDQAA